MNTRYVIAQDGKSIRCNTCGRISYNPSDVAEHYCGNCHVFHDAPLMPAETFKADAFVRFLLVRPVVIPFRPEVWKRGCITIIAEHGLMMVTVTDEASAILLTWDPIAGHYFEMRSGETYEIEPE